MNINSCEHFYKLCVKYNTSTIAFYKIPFYIVVTVCSTIYFLYIYKKKNKLIKKDYLSDFNLIVLVIFMGDNLLVSKLGKLLGGFS